MRRPILYIAVFYASLIALNQFLSDDPPEMLSRAGRDREERSANTDNPGGFLQYHEGIRTRTGESGPGYRPGYRWLALKEAREASMRKKASARTSSSVMEWKERGPSNVPGRTRAVLNVPGDPTNNTWLAGSATGGIWRTTDGGLSWSERSINFPALPVSSFASDRNGTVIYAGTGEFVSSFYSAMGNGIFKSTDKGSNWTQIPSTANSPDFAIVTRVITDPDNSNIIVATTAPSNTTTDQTSAIMRSTDGGLTWTRVLEQRGNFEQITFTPSNFSIQYATLNAVGVWKSVDAGATWKLSNKNMSPDGRIELSVSPVNPNVIFASAQGILSGTGSDLYYSQDGASSWSLVHVKFNNQTVDFLEGQGFYDNTILCDPFNAKSFYVGGVSLFRTTLTSGTTGVDNYKIIESGTQPFLALQAFNAIPYDHQRLNTGPDAGKDRVEIRFGPGLKQKGHRFLVPTNRTNGLTAAEYNFVSYTDVPFQVWNMETNQQLMVSYRDQNRNGRFDLVPSYLTNDGVDYLINSREYIYIHDVPYAITPNSDIARTGGHEHSLKYNIFPALANNATWNEDALPSSRLIIEYSSLVRYNAMTDIIADGRGRFDGKNSANQVDLTKGVHPDHHALAAIIENVSLKRFKLLLGNDGGVFVSKTSGFPGTAEGDWQFRGYGYNTGQFYGADKRPGVDQYVGGMQDNGTRISPATTAANAASKYNFAVDGDGFEVIWNNKDPSRLLATRYYGDIAKSDNGGVSWKMVANGENDSYPFVTKLANARDFPDRVFTVGAKGVYVSENFGETWKLTAIPSRFVLGSSFFLDVEVSRANASIVWAGSGMNEGTTQRNLHVSVDGGRTFKATRNYTARGLGNITRLATHPLEPNTAYALFSFANGPKILRTTDLGETWQDISGFGSGTASANGFPDVAIYCLYVRPDDPNIIWAGTEIGIVESTDNGTTWALIDEFPNVSVWDMKGLDDQVVIATHGRGIWTARVQASQHSTTAPGILAAGSTPHGKFAIRINSTEFYDSLRIVINGTTVRKFTAFQTGVTDVEIAGLPPGSKEIKVVGFRGNAPVQSVTTVATHHNILNPRDTYSSFFRSSEDVAITGLTMQFLDGMSRPYYQSLQTNHNYSPGQQYEIFIKTPIYFSRSFPRVLYKDIAIVEPDDEIVVEVTRNGLDWIVLHSYDASYDAVWASALQQNGRGTGTMYLEHDINFGEHFAESDLLLFRLRLLSNATVTSWGWAIEQISIQQLPTGIEERPATSASLFPNPTSGVITIEYAISKPTRVTAEVTSVFGSRACAIDFGMRPAGTHRDVVDISGSASGTYLLVLSAGDEKTVRKFVKTD